ncbi:MAG TPA: YfcC family protein [Candidatus Ligilactobacillus excrementigallinarum]|uniref:YfcC family protein n=1 Tax=Candidatus Ligilactobacillus excrementigallinarum TaxID=2838641 RepID=A0A9D2AAT3_9LACO|nr:YfcC family protein [Candidatus Ligilactobacillus excrementigallinarum]
MDQQKKKHHFKMPSAFTILFLLIILMAVLSWIIPAGAYKLKDGSIIAGSYHRVAQHPQGIWDVFMAPIIGMIGDKSTEGAISISLFILVIGGFLAVVNKTNALDQGIGSIVSKYRGKEKALIPVLMILFALGGTTFGMAEETMAFYPLLIPVMISCGFDSMVALGIVIIGSQVGCLASTVNPFATGVASQSLGISPGDGLMSRVILLVITLGISIWYVYSYASKIEKDPKKSIIYDQREADLKHFDIDAMTREDVKMTGRQKAVIAIFGITFFIMVLGLIPWDSINKHFTFFNSFAKWLTNVPFLGALIGKDLTPFGSWYFSEITMLFLFMSVLIMFVYHMSEKEFVDTFLSGMADFISVAMIVAVARGIQVIMNNGMITDTVLHWGEMGLQHLSSSAFSIIAYIFYIPMSFLIPSTSGLASATMGIIGPLGEFAHVAGNVIVTAFQAASGWVNLITPTSAVIMGALAIARVNISKWWKWIAKLMVILFVVTCVYLGILAVI